ncbi:MAG: diguanylate cyclase [Candidatus Thiodiazotropha sp. (ex Ctena orbiculata)]|uniref:Diguanylate cyclase n=1 Tax=Candidatus Thiodiazotropha taylori TaxID=2792791 RepID=A0A944MD68_9GAMM|nr:diguanylate cyclase [Candidatus Thiodiazotropha taylori]MBT2990504.1 diguanylate cyclase [Candidatus Thiodiazotropha taylori]MBT2998561.1 diguanylate cyclase [Candidatus Thiodiazotropha taylori]MBT3002735.1 diguanylate cyclase [Candidatus Thiodiazotropha taylori]MBT3028877.1 diguanylate cyclase [Candidatus Thiodiazotropha taylori]
MQNKEDSKKSRTSIKGRLLIVDDESRHAESLAMMVASWGYDVHTAADGAKAAGLLISKPFDVVLLDLHMPVADGYKVMDFIRKRGLKTRIITVSGDPSMDDAIKSLKKGADNFIRKPVTPVDLLKAIDESLRKKVKEEQREGVKRKIEVKSSLHRMMFDVAPNMQFLLDIKGNFRMVNTVFTKVTGYSKQEILGKHWSSLVEGDQIERMHHVFEERRTAPDRFPEVELRLRCKDSNEESQNRKPRTVLVALQSRRLYTQQGKKKVFFGTYGVARDITQYNKLEELNKYQEFHDSLTGLPNRVLFEDYLSFALTQAKQENTQLCLLNVVLVDLKQINERYGHAVGDECLKTISARLKQHVRKGDILSRIDGSEFALLLPHIQDGKSVVHISEKLRIGLSNPIEVTDRSISLDLTIGSAAFPSDGDNSEDLLRHAQTSHGFHPLSKQRHLLQTSNWIKLIKTQH